MVLEKLLYPLHAIGFFPVTRENIKKPLILGVYSRSIYSSRSIEKNQFHDII